MTVCPRSQASTWSPSGPTAPDCVGIVAFTVADHAPGKVAAYLSAEHAIGVRDGRFCAHPLLTSLGLDAALRASIGLGTTAADVDRLIGAVSTLVTNGPTWNYAATDGHWNPTPETRPLTASSAEGAAPCLIG